VPARRSEGAAEGTSSRCFLSSSERATTREPVSCRQEMRYWNDGWQTGSGCAAVLEEIFRHADATRGFRVAVARQAMGDWNDGRAWMQAYDMSHAIYARTLPRTFF